MDMDIEIWMHVKTPASCPPLSIPCLNGLDAKYWLILWQFYIKMLHSLCITSCEYFRLIKTKYILYLIIFLHLFEVLDKMSLLIPCKDKFSCRKKDGKWFRADRPTHSADTIGRGNGLWLGPKFVD